MDIVSMAEHSVSTTRREIARTEVIGLDVCYVPN